MKWFRGYLFVFSLCILRICGKIEYNTVRDPMVRVTAHVKKVVDKVCLLKPETGPCRVNAEMYYFNPKIMNCSTFRWGGCQGNGNRYDTLDDCLEACLSHPGRSNRPHWCALRWDYGYCFGEVKRWYYDKKWQTCKEGLYSGCGGNKNNFYSQEQCDSVCRFGHGFITTASTSAKYQKFIIINPGDSTAHRGLEQPTMKTTKKTTKCVEEIKSRKDNADVAPGLNQTNLIP